MEYSWLRLMEPKNKRNFVSIIRMFQLSSGQNLYELTVFP